MDGIEVPGVVNAGHTRKKQAAQTGEGRCVVQRPSLLPPLDSPGKKETGDNQGHAPNAVFIECQDSSRTIRTVLASFCMEIGFSMAPRMPFALNFTWSISPLKAE